MLHYKFTPVILTQPNCSGVSRLFFMVLILLAEFFKFYFGMLFKEKPTTKIRISRASRTIRRALAFRAIPAGFW